MFGMNGWCKEPNNAGNGSDCPKNAQNSEDRTTGDLISRAAVLEELADLYWTEERFLTFKDVDGVFDRIKALPSAQPERMRGKWIYGEDEYGIDGYHCNQCGFFVLWDYAHKFINYIEDYHFCPNCGADMKGEDDE